MVMCMETLSSVESRVSGEWLEAVNLEEPCMDFGPVFSFRIFILLPINFTRPVIAFRSLKVFDRWGYFVDPLTKALNMSK